MNLAVERTESFEERMASVTEKTRQAGLLLISFCKIEQMHLAHPKNEIRPHFVSWIKHQEAKYYNQFIVGFFHDVKRDHGKWHETTTPPEMFMRLRQAAREVDNNGLR